MSLDALSKHYGIVDSFIDARGELRPTSDATRRALLAAMGVEANDDSGSRQALEEVLARESEQCLPPVIVHYSPTDALEVQIGGPVRAERTWRLQLEDGGIERGSVRSTADALHEDAAAARSYLRIEAELPLNYHMLTLEPDESHCSLIVTPGQCWLADGVGTGRKLWGVAAQLYLLRSQANWGIGDYGDLKHLVQTLVARGADVVGLNPLHAMFPDDPEQASPYSPASRLLLNILNIDVASVAASMDCAVANERMASTSFQEALARCRAASLVDYSGVTSLKLPLLRLLFDCGNQDSSEWRALVQFRADAGDSFERGCLYLALREHFARASGDTMEAPDWR